MTPFEAFSVISKARPNQTFIECVDLGEMYGFVFLDWDESRDGTPTPEKAHELFLINGWSTVDKRTGKIGEVNALYYFADNPKKMQDLRHIDLPKAK